MSKVQTYSARSYVATPKSIERQSFVFDMAGKVLGRAASKIALVLRGKHKPDYTPNINCGDHVIVINADQMLITGKKLRDNKFFWHTGYPGGIKEKSWATLLKTDPTFLVYKAVQRMLPKQSPLARQQFKLLRVYAGPEHPHGAQQPTDFPILW